MNPKPMDPKTLLIKILTVIGYEEDKDQFADRFLQNIRLQSLVDLLSTLPADRQEEVKAGLVSAADNPEALAKTVTAYFPETQLREALEEAAKESITAYLQRISPTLSPVQREALARELAAFAQEER